MNQVIKYKRGNVPISEGGGLPGDGEGDADSVGKLEIEVESSVIVGVQGIQSR